MPPTSSHQSRPRLGTVLSRKHWDDRRSNSTTSSVNSQGSVNRSIEHSLDLSDEAFESTAPPRAPPLQTWSQKSSEQDNLHDSYHPQKDIICEESDNEFNTADLSIELGRGAHQGERKADDSRNDDSLDTSGMLAGVSGAVYPSSLPTKHRSKPTGHDSHARNLRQDAQIRQASMASQKENRDPAPQPFKSFKSSEQANRVKRKTLGELNLRASEMYDGSLLNDNRPTQTGPATRTTRFSRSKRQASKTMVANGANIVADAAEISHSYILPDLPNMSQLVSATAQEGTPERSRRMAHPAVSQTPTGPAHKEIDAVPIPNDERAIFVSLNVLQGRVNELEAATVAFQRTIDHLKTKNYILEAERKDLSTENESLRQENQELRASHGRSDQGLRNDTAHQTQASPGKKGQTTVTAQVNNELHRLVKDRQEEDLFCLTPSDFTKDQANGARPSSSVAAAKRQSSYHTSNIQKPAAATGSKNSKKVMIDENATKDANREAPNLAREQPSSANVTYLTTDRIARHMLNLRNLIEAGRVERKKAMSKQPANEPGSSIPDAAPRPAAVQPTIQQLLAERKSCLKDAIEQVHEPDVIAATTTKAQPGTADSFRPAHVEDDDSENDIDQVSRPLSGIAHDDEAEPTATATSNISRRRRRPTELEDDNVSSALLLPDITTDEPATTSARPTATASGVGAGARASAQPTKTNGETTQLTTAAQHVIDGIDAHDAANCIICARLTATKPDYNNKNMNMNSGNSSSNRHATIKVPKPIPVSISTSDPKGNRDQDPNMTQRPAQPPNLALACVVKELTDQHHHLRARLAQAQDRYQQSDPRLGRGRRGALRKQVKVLMARCDGVADMIYRLYDVVEVIGVGGDDAADAYGGGGGGMTEDEVEVTIQGLREVVGRMGEVSEVGDGEE